MRIIYKAPGCAPEVRSIPNTLESLQRQVGGHIEAVSLGLGIVSLICNEEGRLIDMPFNCFIGGYSIYGPLLLVGISGENFCSVPDAFADLCEAHCLGIFWEYEEEME